MFLQLKSKIFSTYLHVFDCILFNTSGCLEITGDPNLLIISVYLPCKGSPNSQNEFQECIDQLHEIMSTYEQTHQVIIGGDFNEEITNINTTTRQQYEEKLSQHL
jgi:exonuclease III